LELMHDSSEYSRPLVARIAAAEIRASRQRAHILRLRQRCLDTQEASALLELMLRAIGDMREVQSTLSGFGRGM
jgi:hypothetical protein